MVRKLSGQVAGPLFLAFFLLTFTDATYSQPHVGGESPLQAQTVPVKGKTTIENGVADATTTVHPKVPTDLKDLSEDLSDEDPPGKTGTAQPGSFLTPPTEEAKALEKLRADLNASKKQTAGGWQFGFAPYLYATGIHGTVAAQGRELEIDSTFGNVLSNLDLGIMGALEARKGKLSLLSDLMWIKLSQKRDTPGGLYGTAKVGINLFIFDPELGYRLAGSNRGGLDVVGGVRIWSVETNINVTSGLLPGFDVSQRKTWAAPVIGLRGTYDMTSKFYLSSKFDIGGFGVGADFTTQFYGGVGYRLTKHIAAVGGYRYLMVDYDDDQGFLFDTNMNGFLFGAKFTF